MAHYSDASSFVPNLNHGMFTGSKSSFRLLQGAGIRRAFNNFRTFDFVVFAEQVAAVSDHAALSPDMVQWVGPRMPDVPQRPRPLPARTLQTLWRWTLPVRDSPGSNAAGPRL
jgi:hypothetical protein